MGYRGFGRYKEALAAKTMDPKIMSVGQDGGVTTALLCYSIDNGIIDGAVLTRKSGPKWVPEQVIATSKKEIIECTGSIYALSPNMYKLKDAVREYALEKVGYVGLPCQIDALRKMQLYPFGARGIGERIALALGIFCSENFHMEGLRTIIEGYCKMPIEDVNKMHITKGKFMVEGKKHAEVGMKKASRYAQDGDSVCPDLVAEYADISIGSIGSEEGWNTVFLRTRKGIDTFYGAVSAGYIETDDINKAKPGLELLEKLALSKKAAAKENIEKRKAMGLFVTRDQYY
ncbi:coenzyme F420 hydrogenase subunit beta [Methanocella sp. CWC-04]|uniref:Coenzyme F420 hydrogenase subunit beta n=2 Tax=Methanooceanicella nereidis TaxID=2052831 RepID=A0AAP2RF19_9EURY|nr:Coenzyme F420 hydrogenase/dehydrogenase, beta subunit C-terminal domain [Methanocella sp. CWC-04]MCD1296138.1 coenzyme F420 hydrogenase subunit beta [Methanocella sp. CWC-04]